MYKITLVLFFCFNAVLSIFCQSITGNISNVVKEEDKKVRLFIYQNGISELFDSCILYQNNYKLNRPIIEKGVYTLQVGFQTKVNLYLDDHSKNLQLNLDLKQNNQDFIAVLNSENLALSEFNNFFTNYKNGAFIHSNYRNALVSSKKNDVEMVSGIKRDMINLIEQINQGIIKIKNLYPNTYSADVLAPMLMLPDISSLEANDTYIYKEEELIQKQVFSHWNFNDAHVFSNPYCAELINLYAFRWSMKTEEEAKKAIDICLNQDVIARNDQVRNVIVNHLVESYMLHGPVEALVYLADNYMEGCSDLPSILSMKEKLNDLRSITLGQHHLNFQMADPYGKMRDLTSSLGEKSTILLFWSSTCSHCLNELPRIQEIYRKYHENGLAIFAVSLDADQPNWIKFVEQNHLEWINVCDGLGFQSKIVRSYFIFKTPTLFLLDKDGIIVEKNKTADELIPLIENLLK